MKPCQKSVAVLVWGNCGVLFCSIFFMCLSLCQYNSLDYCSYIENFETVRVTSLLFIIVLAFLISKLFHTNFKISLVYNSKNVACILIGITLNLHIHWGVFQFMNMVCLSIYLDLLIFYQCFVVFSMQDLHRFYQIYT